MIRAHAQAVLALLAGTGLAWYDGLVPNLPQLPYVVAYFSSPTPSRTTLCAVSDHLDLEFTTTCVGEDANQVRAVCEAVEGALLDVKPTVAGRQTSRVWRSHSEPTQPDYDVDPPLFYAAEVWGFQSLPAIS